VAAHRVDSLDELDAEQVVIATDGYTNGLVSSLDEAIRPARGQVIVTEPLREQRFRRPHYARHGSITGSRPRTGGWCSAAGATSGWTRSSRAMARRPSPSRCSAHSRTSRKELLGTAPRITHRWSGIYGRTADGLPLVGRVPRHDGVWVAAGYSGHGNVLGLVCGELVAQAILGSPAPELAIFEPARLLS
jgi:gamma-glutamylputrescine oxidase